MCFAVLQETLHTVLDLLSKAEPIVEATDMRVLQTALVDVCNGKAFLLMGGDCAEAFTHTPDEHVQYTHSLLHQVPWHVRSATAPVASFWNVLLLICRN